MDYMKDIPNKFFDLAVVDPPYGIPKTSTHGRGMLKNRILNRDDIHRWDVAPKPEYFKELFRVSKNQIIWGGQLFLPASNEMRAGLGQGAAVGEFLAGGNRMDLFQSSC